MSNIQILASPSGAAIGTDGAMRAFLGFSGSVLGSANIKSTTVVDTTIGSYTLILFGSNLAVDIGTDRITSGTVTGFTLKSGNTVLVTADGQSSPAPEFWDALKSLHRDGESDSFDAIWTGNTYRYVGGSNTDFMLGGSGNDTFEGYGERDTVAYLGERSAYTIAPVDNDEFTITGPDGTDTLNNIERVQFSARIDPTSPNWSAISSASQSEGTGTQTKMVFPVTLDRAADVPISFRLSTDSFSAHFGDDYYLAPPSKIWTIGSGQISPAENPYINLEGDDQVEANETFQVHLQILDENNNPVTPDQDGNVTISGHQVHIGQGSAQGTIGNDDGPNSGAVYVEISDPALEPFSAEIQADIKASFHRIANQLSNGWTSTVNILVSSKDLDEDKVAECDPSWVYRDSVAIPSALERMITGSSPNPYDMYLYLDPSNLSSFYGPQATADQDVTFSHEILHGLGIGASHIFPLSIWNKFVPLFSISERSFHWNTPNKPLVIAGDGGAHITQPSPDLMMPAPPGFLPVSSLDIDILKELGYRGLGTTLTWPGRASDGYLSGATVFGDTNNNGILDEGEAHTTTDADGFFSLNGASGPLVCVGGLDTNTHLPFGGILKATSGSSVITPLTTLLTAMADAGITQPMQSVLGAFGLDSAVELDNVDPVVSVYADKPEFFLVGAKVYSILCTLLVALSVERQKSRLQRHISRFGLRLATRSEIWPRDSFFISKIL